MERRTRVSDDLEGERSRSRAKGGIATEIARGASRDAGRRSRNDARASEVSDRARERRERGVVDPTFELERWEPKRALGTPRTWGRSDAYLDHAGAVIAHEGGNLTFIGHVDSLRGRDGTIVSRAFGMSRARWAPPRGERKTRHRARVAHRGLFETAIRAENRAGRVGRGARGRPQDGLGFFTHLCCSSSKATGVRALAVARWLE